MDYIESLEIAKAPPEIIERAKQAVEINNSFDVLPENWEAVQLYQAVKTQWRTGGINGLPIGLDYVAVDIVMRHLEHTAAAFEKLQMMESAVLHYWAESRN